MRDSDCIALLQWALPRMGFRWAGFRKVRRQVCKRIQRRMQALHLVDPAAYRSYLESQAEEWQTLDGLCRITISRFFRDRRVWEHLGERVLPELAARAAAARMSAVEAWSAGCGAGEEAYSLRIVQHASGDPRVRDLHLEIVATDSDRAQLERAHQATFPPGAMRELPEELRQSAFDVLADGNLHLRRAWRAGIGFRCQDLRREWPVGPFALILCRNLAFTYFEEALQGRVLRQLIERLEPHGFLVIGTHESLPAGDHRLRASSGCRSVLRAE